VSFLSVGQVAPIFSCRKIIVLLVPVLLCTDSQGTEFIVPYLKTTQKFKGPIYHYCYYVIIKGMILWFWDSRDFMTMNGIPVEDVALNDGCEIILSDWQVPVNVCFSSS